MKKSGKGITEICWWFWLSLGSYNRDELRKVLAGLQAEMKEYREIAGFWVLVFNNVY